MVFLLECGGISVGFLLDFYGFLIKTWSNFCRIFTRIFMVFLLECGRISVGFLLDFYDFTLGMWSEFYGISIRFKKNNLHTGMQCKICGTSTYWNVDGYS